jgi:hypothetical protein
MGTAKRLPGSAETEIRPDRIERRARMSDSAREAERIWRERIEAELAAGESPRTDRAGQGQRTVRDDEGAPEVLEPAPRPRVRSRAPAPAFADAPWVHAAIGAPVGASLAFVLQAPPRGSIESLVVGALAGALFGVLIGMMRPPPDQPPEFQDEGQDDPAQDRD